MRGKVVMLWVGLLLVGFAAPASAAVVLIDFEGFGNVGVNGPAVTTQFLVDGVTFSSTAGNQNLVSSQPGIGFGLNFICTGTSGISCLGETILTFTDPVSNLSFFQVGDNATGVVAHVDVFVNGLLATTQDIFGDNLFNDPNLVDLTVWDNVTSIRIYGITDPGGLGWDNFSYETGPVSAVPEPGAMLLLASGLAAISARAWRQRRRA